MSNKIKRLQKLNSAETNIEYKHVQLKGISELIENLKEMASNQQLAQDELIESVNTISKTILNKNLEPINVKQIVDALKDLRLAIVSNSSTQAMDYHLSGKRDKNGLMDLDSIKFKAVLNKELH